jgi:hypothetical protein
MILKLRLKSQTPSTRFGEVVLLRVSQIVMLFPDHKHIRTVDGVTTHICDEDWYKVEKAFLDLYGEQPR